MVHQLSTDDFTASLLDYRSQLDALDEQLIARLAARFSVTRCIGALKAVHGVAAADPAREQAQLERLISLSSEASLPTELAREVFETLFRFVRADHPAEARRTSTTPPKVDCGE